MSRERKERLFIKQDAQVFFFSFFITINSKDRRSRNSGSIKCLSARRLMFGPFKYIYIEGLEALWHSVSAFTEIIFTNNNKTKTKSRRQKQLRQRDSWYCISHKFVWIQSDVDSLDNNGFRSQARDHGWRDSQNNWYSALFLTWKDTAKFYLFWFLLPINNYQSFVFPTCLQIMMRLKIQLKLITWWNFYVANFLGFSYLVVRQVLQLHVNQHVQRQQLQILN